MNFRSDHVVGVHDAILEALTAANSGTASSYGYDEWTVRAEQQLREIFECDLEAYLVLTGTAANALALSTICPPYGQVLCHAESHIVVDECGAPELQIGSGRLMGLTGAGGKLTPAALERALDGLVREEHQQRPSALSLTQATELGTAYSVDELQALTALARARGLRCHMDGARFANALVRLGVTPAALTWKAGIDVLSLGATKNGAMACEAVVFFDRALAHEFRRRRKRAGQLLSKGRYLGAQMAAYLEGGLWLANARHANTMADAVAAALSRAPGVRVPLPVQANEVFAVMTRTRHRALVEAGVGCALWPGEGPGTPMADDEVLVRFVASYRTSAQDVGDLESALTRV